MISSSVDDVLLPTKSRPRLKSLLDLPRSPPEFVPYSPPTDLAQNVARIVSINTHLHQLLKEASGRIHLGNTHEVLQPTVAGVLRGLQEQARRQGSSMADGAAQLVAMALQDILRSHPKDMLLLTHSEKVEIQALLTTIQQVRLQHGFNRTMLTKAICQLAVLPVELLWRLHQDDLILLDLLLSQAAVFRSLASGIPFLCVPSEQDDDVQLRKHIIADLSSYMLQQGYGDGAAGDEEPRKMTRKVSTAILDKMTERYLTRMVGEPDLNLFAVMMECQPHIEPCVVKKFCHKAVCQLCGWNPELQVFDGVAQQSQWTYAKTRRHIREAYEQLLVPFSATEVLQLLTSILESQEVNWQSLLSMAAVYVVCFEEATACVTEQVASFLSSGLDTGAMERVIPGFLLARQACLEGPHRFPPYHNWFASTFGDETRSPANNKKSFAVLMRFLTKVLPIEPAYCLKAHLLHLPFVPAKCRPLLSEYVMLAKTRLSDLQESLEDAGIFAGISSVSGGDNERSAVEQDVDRALAVFTSTGKVPSSVMEASIFRKPYFVGRFLATLLTPRPLPDLPDDRMKLIDILHRADKIPGPLFLQYETACKRESAILLEGVMDEEEDDLTDLLLTPFQQVQVSLTNLVEKIIKSQGSGAGLGGQISVVSEKLQQLWDAEPSVSRPPQLTKDGTTGTQCSHLHFKAVDLLLNTVCQVMADLSGERRPQSGWLPLLMTLLKTHPALKTACLHRIMHLLVCNGAKLTAFHLRGLSAVCVHLSEEPALLPQVATVGVAAQRSFVGQLVTRTPCCTRLQMIAVLSFCTWYLEYWLCMFVGDSCDDTHLPTSQPPQPLCQKFWSLVTRLLPADTVHASANYDMDPVLRETALTIFRSEQFTCLISAGILDFREWIRGELAVDPEQDVFLSDWARLAYYEQTVLSRFLNEDQERGGCGGSSIKACSIMAREILQFMRDFPCGRQPPAGCLAASSDCCDRIDRGLGNSRQLLLRFLHHCCEWLVQADGPTADTPWLYHVFQDHLQTLTKDSLSQPQTVADFVSVQTALPSYLFLKNTPQDEMKLTYLNAAIEFTNSYLRPCLSEGLVLPQAVVSYIVKALDTLGNDQRGEKMAATYRKRCDCMMTSLLYWHSVRGPSLLLVASPAVQGLVGQLSVLVDQVRHGTSSADPWLQGFAAFCQMVQGCLASEDILQWWPGGNPGGLDTLASCLCCLMAQIAVALLQGQPLPPNLQTSCMELVLGAPLVLMRLMEPGSLPHLRAALPPVPMELLPLAMTRVLLFIGTQRLLSVVKEHIELLAAVLEIHKHLVQCYHQQDSVTSSEDQRKLDSSSGDQRKLELVDTEVLLNLNTLVKSLITGSDSQQLLLLPQTVVESSDPDIRLALLMKMR